MSKLLNRQLKLFTLFAFFILIASVPVYYLVINQIWVEELDEHNKFIRDEVQSKLSAASLKTEKLNEITEFWNALEPGTKLEAIDSTKICEDRIYEIQKEDQQDAGEFDRYRVLSSDLKVGNQYYRLTVETNLEEAGEMIGTIALLTITFFLLMFLGFVFLNKRISARVWKPFRSTLDHLKGFRLSDEKAINFEETTVVEFAELNRELEKLISNNLEAYQKQKRFVENASHELQTPLAILKSKLELLMQSEGLTDKQAELVSAISQPLSRMTRLNKNLLILAKIENQQFMDAEELDLGDVLQENIQLLQDYFLAAGLELKEEIQLGKMVRANRFLLETLYSNLLTNAIKFAGSGDRVNISLKGEIFEISNVGEKELSAEGLFERFTNVSENDRNSGLGLAIVKEICTFYDWKLTYRFEEKRHVFSVTF